MKRRTRRSPARGFTLIEVMVSLGIMTIGAMAVIALQTQTIRANSYARQVTTATQIAQTWIERLKEDSATWTQVATMATQGTVLNSTLFLKSIATAPGAYVTPGVTNAPVSCAFNYLGADTNVLGTGADAPFYCAAYRLNWVYVGEAMRADVRVWWPRAGAGAGNELPACGDGYDQSILDPGGSAFSKYHVVYLSTVIRLTPVPR